MSVRLRPFDVFDAGFSWVVDEPMRRTSHALADDGRVWLVDPIDAPEGLERAQGLGEVVGVLQLLDRHNRDCAQIARRLGVPHARVPDDLPATPFGVLPVLRWPRWRESALWWPQRRVLVVAELVGTAPVYTAGRTPAGIHLFLRVHPPSRLRGMQPEHLLVGHGEGIHGAAAAAALEQAYAWSLRDLPHVIAALPRTARP
ncbi:MAG TPA: hypothetical protein VN751_12885 [Solirubrobacteraceae bacterium]|nr:hypothetical protein [Solirubrobacteraceae bacterium]